jgi:hypothetical protein
VVVAHQFLMLRGEAGYVDGSGSLNQDFKRTEERIDHFRRLGAAIVERLSRGTAPFEFWKSQSS